MTNTSNKRKIELVPGNHNWRQAFEKEARKIEKIFPNQVAIHHIGSTAIEGIKAKPVIDILLVVEDISIVDDCVKRMEGLGYIFRGENGLPGRRYFEKGYPVHTHHLHVFERDSPEIERHLAFRDYLNNHPEEAQVYSALKEKLAAEYRTDPEGYTEAKGDFIRAVENKAMDLKSGE